MRPGAALAAALSAAGLVLAGCSGSVLTGNGSAGPSSSSSGHDFPSRSSTVPTSSTTTAPSSSPPQQPLQVLQVQAGGGPLLTMSLWAKDQISDCAAHSDGKVANFFRKHQCRNAGRLLWTFPFHGRTVALAVANIGMPSAPEPDIYRWAGELIKLLNADNTGSINDLLREGHTIPGTDSVPADEAFRVVGQDTGVCVFDAWYVDGSTVPQDRQLLTLEEQLYLTPATNQPP